VKAEYLEGPKARENFEKAMKAAFHTPKKKAPAKPKLTDDDERRRDRRSPISRIERGVDKVTPARSVSE